MLPDMTPEKLAALENLLAETQSEEELEGVFGKLKNIMGSEKTEDCQRIIDEEHLEQWLKQGWKVVSVLPSGKIVIDNE